MTINKPAVSVIIPTYNRAKTITYAIDSVLNQTFTDYEIIIVDDGSTDNTYDVLFPYLHEIKFIRKPNGGASSARNVGLNLARGEWVAFLDSDDMWFERKLEIQIEFNKKHQLDVSFTNTVINSEKKIEVDDIISAPLELFLINKAKLYIITLLTKRSILKYFDETLMVCEDLKMFYDIATKTDKWGFIGKPLASVTRDISISGLMNNKTPDKVFRIASDSFIVHFQAYLANKNADPKILRKIKKHISYYSFVLAEISAEVNGYFKSIGLVLNVLINSVTFVIFIKTLAILFMPIKKIKQIKKVLKLLLFLKNTSNQ